MPRITVEKIGRVAVLTLNDPERRNALSLDLNQELNSALDTLEEDFDSVIDNIDKAKK